MTGPYLLNVGPQEQQLGIQDLPVQEDFPDLQVRPNQNQGGINQFIIQMNIHLFIYTY